MAKKNVVKSVVNVQLLRDMGASEEDIENAISSIQGNVKTKIIERALSESDIYGAYVAIGILTPKAALDKLPENELYANQQRWQDIQTIHRLMRVQRIPTPSARAATIQAENYSGRGRPPGSGAGKIHFELEKFKEMCQNPNISYPEIGEYFGVSQQMARMYAVKYNVNIERQRGRKAFTYEIPGEETKFPEAPEVQFAGAAGEVKGDIPF